MAKKFFYNRVYNTKRTIINIIIIGVCIIGVIVCFIITSNFQGKSNKPKGELSIKKEVTVEINEDFSKEIFFSKIKNVDLDTIKIKYPNNYDNSKVGIYEIKINVDNKDYDTILNIVDTKKPELELKELTIKEGESYDADDFVTSCNDNSNKKCNITFYTSGQDQNGNVVDYASYNAIGNYSVKISATDESGNQTVEETKLNIIKKSEPIPEQPKVEEPKCNYGDGNYDTDNYLIAINVTTNNCAISLDLYKSEVMTAEINKLMETETTRIKKDVEALNLTGTLALNRKVTAVANVSGNGIVGYELKMTVTITDNGDSKVVTDYKVDNKGKRVFIENPYNLGA